MWTRSCDSFWSIFLCLELLSSQLQTNDSLSQTAVCIHKQLRDWQFNVGLQYGLNVADSDPKSPWISTKDDLPCNHEELIFLGGLINGSETIEVFVRYESGDIWSDYMFYENGKWKWNDGEPDYWMIPPKLPKIIGD